MKKLVCMFSGWFEVDVNDVMLLNPETRKVKSASDVLVEHGSIDGWLLESFDDANRFATDGTFEQLDLSIDNDD